jgi:hypothetical protein
VQNIARRLWSLDYDGQSSASNIRKNAIAFYYKGEQAVVIGAVAMSDCKI